MGESMRITVIATGFGQIKTSRPRFSMGETAPQQDIQRPTASVDEPAARSFEDNLEMPAFLRRRYRDQNDD
jgi:hypothetical protein